MIERIIETGRSCTGCSACYSACPFDAITMELKDGFYHPAVNDKNCVNCRKCASVCPQNAEQAISEYQTKAYACKNLNDDIRADSASGGFFTAIAEHVIKQGGIVYGVAFDRDFTACHVRTDSAEKLSELRHSKYMQSNAGNTYKNVKRDLESKKTVLFVGTPCQCAGLNSFLNKEYDSLYIAKVLCHGVPSPVVWKNYLQFIMKKKKASSIKKIVLHSKNSCSKASWSNSYTHIELNNSTYNINGNHDPFMMLFARANIILNLPCYNCQYRNALNSPYADISMSDFWGIERIDKEFNDGKGISLVMLHSKKAENLFSELNDTIACREVNPAAALSNNSSSSVPQKRRSDRKILKLLVDHSSYFGIIYYAYLPVIYLRKIAAKIFSSVFGEK